MKTVETENEGLKRAFMLTIPAKDIEAHVDREVKRIAPQVRMPGFRPGKVPPNLIRKMHGESLQQEALSSAVQQGVQTLLTEKKIRPAMQPEVELGEGYEHGKDAEVKVRLETLPDVPAPKIDKLALERLTVEADDSAVDAQIKTLASSQKNWTDAKKGHKAATGDLLCLCNSDLIFFPGWLPPMVTAFDRYKAIGMVGNLQRRVDNNWIDHLGVFFLPNGMPLHVAQNKTYVPVLRYLPVSAVTAACCMIRKSLFQEFGGFSDDYLNGFEDTDLCLRLTQAGYQNYVATRSEVRHHISASPGRKTKENQNLNLFCERWLAVTKVIAEKEAATWDTFHYILQAPQFVRWPLLLQTWSRFF